MSSQLDEIQDLTTRIVESEGMELVDIEYKPGRNRSLLRIYIDKVGGVTVNDCENVSRQVSAILEVKDPIKTAYVLEVSSPGLDRPLRTDRDYSRALGRNLRVNVIDDSGTVQVITGKLVESNPDQVVLEEQGKPREIARNHIKRAVHDITLGQPKKNRKNRK